MFLGSYRLSGGESVSQPPLKDKAFDLLDQNPPLPSENGISPSTKTCPVQWTVCFFKFDEEPYRLGADGSNLATFSQIARVPAGKFCPGLSLWILLKPRRQWRRHWQDGFVDALANIAGRGSLGAMRQHYTPILQAETASASFT